METVTLFDEIVSNAFQNEYSNDAVSGAPSFLMYKIGK